MRKQRIQTMYLVLCLQGNMAKISSRKEGDVQNGYCQVEVINSLHLLKARETTRKLRQGGGQCINRMDYLQGGVANIFPQVNLLRDVVIYRVDPRRQPIFLFLLPIGEEVLGVLQEMKALNVVKWQEVMTSYHHCTLREMCIHNDKNLHRNRFSNMLKIKD